MDEQMGKVIWSFEEYLKKAELAIKDKTMRFFKEEIIRTKRSPNWVWRRAKTMAKVSADMGVDVNPEALASSYWALAKLKRDFPEKFKEIKFESEGKEMSTERKISLYADEMNNVRATTVGGGKDQVRVELKYVQYGNRVDLVVNAMSFLTQVPAADFLAKDHIVPTLVNDFRDRIIQILEEHYGLKVKICGNCGHFNGFICGHFKGPERVSMYAAYAVCEALAHLKYIPIEEMIIIECEDWAPKEVSERPSVPPPAHLKAGVKGL